MRRCTFWRQLKIFTPHGKFHRDHPVCHLREILNQHSGKAIKWKFVFLLVYSMDRNYDDFERVKQRPVRQGGERNSNVQPETNWEGKIESAGWLPQSSLVVKLSPGHQDNLPNIESFVPVGRTQAVPYCVSVEVSQAQLSIENIQMRLQAVSPWARTSLYLPNFSL